jgi:hypothetical protein
MNSGAEDAAMEKPRRSERASTARLTAFIPYPPDELGTVLQHETIIPNYLPLVKHFSDDIHLYNVPGRQKDTA